MASSNQSSQRKSEPRLWLVGLLSGYALAGGVFSLLGWYARIPRLTDWVDSGIAMFANTALTASVTGAALLSVRKPHRYVKTISLLAGLLVMFIGAATLFEHLTGVDLRIDQILVEQTWGLNASVVAGRMGPPAAIAFTLLGLALILLERGKRARHVASMLGLVATGIGALSLLGYLFHANPLYALARLTGIAFQTASIVLALGLAVVALIPECQPVRILQENTAAGMLARRALPFIIIVPIVLGWLRVMGQNIGLYDTALGTAMLVIAVIMLFCALLWWSLQAVDAYEREHKKASEALELVSRLPQENPSPVMRLRPDGVLAYTNRAANEVLSQWGRTLGQDAPAEITEIASIAFAENTKRLLESTVGEKTYSLVVVPVREGNYVNLYFNDITDRKQAEDERRRLLEREQSARADAERANQMKDQFLAVCSHELRTPLTPILGWTRLLRNLPRDDNSINRAADVIERNVKIETQLIEDLLDVSRITSGKLKLNVEPTDVVAVIRDAIEAVRQAAHAKTIRIESSLDKSVTISADPARLQQIVWNLLSNAVKFTQPAGTVRIRLEQNESNVNVIVSDDGEGISAEFLPHLFEQFRQADSSATRTHGGLGLGLSIVKNLVEMHGGTIRAESAGEGKGSTFTVSLPRLANVSSDGSGVAPHSKLELPDQILRGLRILVVDDQRDTCDVLAAALREYEVTVITALSANEAYKLLEGEHIDVLISDIGMPGEDGYALLRKIRKCNDRRGKIPAIALTAYAKSEDRAQALAAGFQEHVAKPVDPAELKRTICNVRSQLMNAELS